LVALYDIWPGNGLGPNYLVIHCNIHTCIVKCSLIFTT